MNLDRAVERAESVRGPREAQRLYADIDYELALGEGSEEQYDHGEEALRVLERRFPDVRAGSRTIVQDGHLPNLSRKASLKAMPGEEPHHQPGRRPGAKAGTRGRPRRSSSRRGGRVGRRALRGFRDSAALVAPHPVKELAGLAWTFFLAGLGLSAIYLILNRPGVVTDLTSGALSVFVRLSSPHYDLLPADGSKPVPKGFHPVTAGVPLIPPIP